jgi:hypothetical protein
MPLIDPNQRSLNTGGGIPTIAAQETGVVTGVDRPATESMGLWEAGLTRNNLTYNALTSFNRSVIAGDVDPDFNPYNSMAGFEQYSDYLDEAINPMDMELRKANITKLQGAQQTLNESSWLGTGVDFLTAVADPMMLPFLFLGPSGAALRAGMVGRAAYKAGVAATAEAVVAETVLHAYQPTRTFAESVLNVGSSALLGGLIGYGAAKYSGRRLGTEIPQPITGTLTPDERMRLVEMLDNELNARGELDVATGRQMIASDYDSALNARITRLVNEAPTVADMDAYKLARSAHVIELRRLNTTIKELEKELIENPSKIRKKEIPALLEKVKQDAVEAGQRFTTFTAKGANRVPVATVELANIAEWQAQGFTSDRIFRALDQKTTPDKVPPLVENTPELDKAEAIYKEAPEGPLITQPSSGGAAAATTVAQTQAMARADLVGESRMTRWLAYLSPLGRQITGPSQMARERVSGLAEHTFKFRENGETLTNEAAAETRVKQWTEGRMNLTRRDAKRLWKAHRKAGGMLTHAEFNMETARAMRHSDQSADPHVSQAAKLWRDRVFDPLYKMAKEERLLDEHIAAVVRGLFAEMRTEVAEMVRTGQLPAGSRFRPDDEAVDNMVELLSRPNPQKADWAAALFDDPAQAQAFVNHPLFNRFDDIAARMGNPQTAETYMYRLYDRNFIELNLSHSIGVIQRWLADGRQAVLDARAVRLGVPPRRLTALEQRELQEQATRLIGDIRGVSRNISDIWGNGLSDASPSMARTLMIEDDVLDAAGMLVNDIEQLATAYIRGFSPRIELAKYSAGRGEAGAWRLERDLELINEDYDRLLEDVANNPNLTAAQRREQSKSLQKQQRQAGEDFTVMQQRLLGVYDMPNSPAYFVSRLPGWIKAFNFVNKMGGMAVSSITDVARPIMQHGLYNSWGRIFLNPLQAAKAWRGNLNEMYEAGTALDMVSSMMARQLASFDDIPPITRAEVWRDKTTHLYSVVVGMSPWNTAMKGFTGLMGQDRFLKTIRRISNGDTVSVQDVDWLRENGISDDMVQRIAAEPWNTKDGFWLANTDAWQDDEAVNVFRAALAKIADTGIVTRGIGDMPNFMKGPWAGVLLQFKSFAITTVNRVILPMARVGFTERQMRAYSGAMVMLGMGTLVYKLKSDTAAWGTDEESKFTATWDNAMAGDPAAIGTVIGEALDRSGLLGALLEPVHVAEKLSGGALGLNTMASRAVLLAQGENPLDAPKSFTNRNMYKGIIGQALGPSISTIEDIAKAGGYSFETLGERQDVPAEQVAATMRRLLPFQNVFYLTGLFNMAEKWVAE